MNTHERAKALFLKMAICFEESGMATNDDEALMIQLGISTGLFDTKDYDAQAPESEIEPPVDRIVFRDAKVVARVTYNSDGSYFVKCHPIIGGSEFQPRGYWLGSNSMSFTPKTKIGD